MTTRRYGPVEGAGTSVIEKDAEKTISKGKLGTTVYVGILERGPVNKLFRNATKSEYLKRAGGYIDDSLVPDCSFDFYSTSRGAGELYHVRVTDGSEVKSSLTIKGRKRESIIKPVVADCDASGNAFLSAANYVAMGSPKTGARMAVFKSDGSTALMTILTVTADTPSAGITEIEFEGAPDLSVYTLALGSQLLLLSSLINPDVMKVEAHNGGRWGGKEVTHIGLDFGVGGLTTLTFDSELTLLKDALKGALLTFAAIPGKSYEVVSNDVLGVVTVSADKDMAADYLASGSADETWKLTLLNEDKELSVFVKDSVKNPTTMFGLDFYLDGVRVLNYDELDMNPNSKYYYESFINDDDNNDFVAITNLWVGSYTADIRPANVHGQSTVLANTVLTMDRVEVLPDGANTGDGYFENFTYGGDVQPDVIEVEVLSLAPATFKYTSTKLGLIAGASPVVGTTFVAPNDYGIGFDVKEGAAAFIVGDKFQLIVNPLKAGELIGGYIYPNVDSDRRTKFKITANTVNTVTVKTSDLMLANAIAGNTFRIESLGDLGGGYDGIADITDADYIKSFDPPTSPINSLFGMGKGLVKIAAPGVTATAVQKAGYDYAEARNYQWRNEIPSNIVTEQSAEEYINDTLGRNDFAVVEFPSYMYVTHPTKAGLKLVPTTGAAHGREALVAKNYLGYHKASTGIDVTYPMCVKLPTEDKVLDEEFLNPHGINVVKFKDGLCIKWGDRSLSIDPAWKWKHQREQMSYYENDMREKFDWIIFAINDAETEKPARSALRSYFEPEHKKRALRGDTFRDAVEIKIDAENNTNATRADGDMLAEVSLRLADTVERFIITMSKLGIFESVG